MTSDPTTPGPGGEPGVPAEPDAPTEAPDRNLALELVRVTEPAAMAGGRWVGRGDKNGADGAAVAAMRALISTVEMRGVVVIGEGEKDDAPMFNGEKVGDRVGAISTQSIVMRSRSGTIRVVDAEHQQAKLPAYAAVDCSGARR